MTKRQFLFVCTALSLCLHAALGLTVTPDDSALRYTGRFSDDYQFGWTGSQIELDFVGSTIEGEFVLTAGQSVGLTVVVDGTPHFLKIIHEQTTYPLAEGLSPDERHHLVIFKRNEGGHGTVQFKNFQLAEGSQIFKPAELERKIMVVGDSITCGYGNEAASKEEGNTVENENGYMSYAAIAARSLNADIMMVCWSGRGFVRNFGAAGDKLEKMPELFGRTLPTQKTPEWDNSRFVPDVVVINLGTNDMNMTGDKPPLDKEAYTSAYKTFLARIRAFAPDAKFILSIGPMAFEPVSEWLPELAAGDDNMSVLIYEGFVGPEDIGGHWHPTVLKDKKMATELVTEIQKVTDWK